MATAGRITVAEVEELVEPGVLDPDSIHTPGISYSASSTAVRTGKKIEKRTVRRARRADMPWSREDLAARAARELKDGYYVNLGIGFRPSLPTTSRRA